MNEETGAKVYQFPAQPTARSPRQRERLKAAHRRAACRLEVIFDPKLIGSDLVSRNGRTTLKSNITRLANSVGLYAGLDYPGAYKRAMLEVYARAARGEDVSKALRSVRNIRQAIRWTISEFAPIPDALVEPETESRKTEAPNPPKMETSSPPRPLTSTVRIGKQDDRFRPFGLFADDSLMIEQVGEPRPGEVVLMLDSAQNQWGGAVRFKRFKEDINGSWFTVEQWNGEVRNFRRGYWQAFRIHSFTRPWRDASTQATPSPGHSTLDPENEQRLSELRMRLQRLKDEGEAHNESGMFRLEKEIFDLEHSKVDDGDEWPKYIDA